MWLRKTDRTKAAEDILAMVAALRFMDDPVEECANPAPGAYNLNQTGWTDRVSRNLLRPQTDTDDSQLQGYYAEAWTIGDFADDIYEPPRHHGPMAFSAEQAIDQMGCGDDFECLTTLFDARNGTLCSHELVQSPHGFLLVTMERTTDAEMEGHYGINNMTWFPEHAIDAVLHTIDSIGEALMTAADLARHDALAAIRRSGAA